jgi:hypothetical protein
MRRKNIYIITALIFLILILLFYQYVFNIYEVNFIIEPKSLFADNQSILSITAIPINAFGWKVPLRKAAADFEIREGNDLIDVVRNDRINGELIIKAKSKPGKVVILIKPELSILPSSFEIQIYPNTA